MALGNWASYILDGDLQIANGPLRSGNHHIVDYKNWLYLYDEDAWTEDIGYRFPTVAEIHEGRLIYKDFHIIAERGPQEGIYFARWVSREPTKALFGVACYGYDDEEWVGVERASIGYLTAFLVRNAREGYPVIDHKLAERIFSMG